MSLFIIKGLTRSLWIRRIPHATTKLWMEKMT